MITENPQIAGLADRFLRQLRDCVFIRQSLDSILRREQPSEFNVLEAEKAYIEVLILKRLDFDAKNVVIPTSIFCQLIVGDDICTLLCFA